MKKDQLKKIIESKITLMKFYGDGNRNYGSAFKNLENMKEEEWFPKIDDLKEEFEILKKEIKDEIKKKKEAEKFLEEYDECDHPVRISNYSEVYEHYEDTCILCGKKIYGSTMNSKKTMHTMANLNKKYALFLGVEDVTPTGFGVWETECLTHYTEEDILSMLSEIVKKTNQEEIDLVDELEKQKIDYCTINKPQNKKLILVITGSSKVYLDKYIYVTRKNHIASDKVVNYFSNLYNTSVEVIGEEDSLKSYKEKEKIIMFEYYSMEAIKKHLIIEKDIPFDLIIDMSSLYNYEIKDNTVKQEKVLLDLETIFPETPIVRVEDFSKDDLDTIKQFLESNKENTYACQYGVYYYIQKNQVIKKYFEDFGDDIKRLVKKNTH